MSERDPNRLPTTVVPSHYDLELAPDLPAGTFAGTVAITLDVHEPVEEIVLHALDLVIEDVRFEQAGADIRAEAHLDEALETMTVSLPQAAAIGAGVLHVRFTGELNDKLVGFYRSTFTDDHGDEQVLACTQFESTHARRAFPCWDEPAFKAAFTVRLVVADDLLAVSNAAERQVDDLGNGSRCIHFETTMVMSTYLVAFVVGPLEATDVVDVDGVPLRVIAPPGKSDLTPFALDVGAFSLRFLTDWYGIDYPGDKLDLVAIPDFAFGAMENLGCVTFRETALLIDVERATQAEQQRVADVIAHEIAHMWFGDLVTMGWWNGIWLNEAFATFMEMLTTDAYRPEWQRWVDFGLARSAAFDTDSLTSTRPIEYEVVTAADAEAMFDILTYEKGASVVRMLQQYLGEAPFQAGIRRYLNAHRYGNTETTDLWDAIEAATGEPVREMMDDWIFRPGHPVIRIERRPDGGGLTLHQDRFGYQVDEQAEVSAPATDVRAVPVVVRIGTDGAEQVHRVLMTEAATDLALDAAPDWIVGNHRSNGFYRVELGDEDLIAATTAGGSFSALERYGLLEDEWALLLAGRGSVRRVRSVVDGFGDDADLSVWQRIAGVLASLHRIVPSERLPGFEADVRALAAPRLEQLGLTRQANETERETALRATVFDTLARTGGDPDTQALAHRWFQALGDDPTAVDPDLADAVVRVVAARADQATWDELRRRAGAARTAQDRLRHQGALADSDDQALVLGFSALTLTDEVRSQDALFLLRRALANRHAGAEVWQFVADHWEEITTRFPSSTVPRLLDGIRGVSDRGLAGTISAFLDANPPAQGGPVIRQHRERMWVTVALADRVRAELGT